MSHVSRVQVISFQTSQQNKQTHNHLLHKVVVKNAREFAGMVFLVEEEEERDWRHENNRDWKLIEKKKKINRKRKDQKPEEIQEKIYIFTY